MCKKIMSSLSKQKTHQAQARTKKLSIENSRGQSLIEYLIVVALMGVASLGVMRLLNHTVTAQFSDVINALQGKTKRAEKQSVKESLYKQKDLSNFMNGAAQRKGKNKSK